MKNGYWGWFLPQELMSKMWSVTEIDQSDTINREIYREMRKGIRQYYTI